MRKGLILSICLLSILIILLCGCKKKEEQINEPPDAPALPTGPSTGKVDSSYTFSTSSVDPDEDSVAIRFDWGDSDTSDWSVFIPSGQTITANHSWSSLGTYNIKAQAKDNNEATSEWSAEDSITITTSQPPPNAPSTPSGPSSGFVDTMYSFTTSYIHPVGDSVSIRFDWDNGDISNWSSYIPSGQDVTMSNSWSLDGFYNIKAQAKDKNNITSDWSSPHSITISALTGWPKTFGGYNDDNGYSVQQTTDHGYIIVGSTRSYGAVDSDIYLIKTDANGNEEWTKIFGGTEDDFGYSVQQTIDGGYIIVGSTESYGSGQFDVYLIKTYSNGNREWEFAIGRSHFDVGHSVQQTSDGGYIIVGATNSISIFGCINVYLIKINNSGSLVWEKQFGDGINDDDVGYSVQQTTDGGYIIAGYTGPYDEDVYDVYLIKTDANGNDIWRSIFGGSGNDVGRSVKQTSDGGYIVAGYTESFGAGGYDVYLIKTNANGNALWQIPFGGSDDDRGYSVDTTSDGGYIVAGYTESFGAGYEDVYLIKAYGSSPWEKTFGGSHVDKGYSVQQTLDEGYIITGLTKSFGAGNSDVYLIKTDVNGNME